MNPHASTAPTQSATSSKQGKILLAGDLGNSAASPQVLSTHLSSALPINQGGTNATSASGARSSLGAAASGANTDITSMTALTSMILASASTGIVFYNTSDQVTNYESVTMAYASNIFKILGGLGGSGTGREILIQTASATQLAINNGGVAGQGYVILAKSSTVSGVYIGQVNGTLTVSSLVSVGLAITPTIVGTSTAGYTALLVNATETSVGSGANKLADFQIAGTSKVSIRNDGVIFPVQAATASAPTYIKGGIYFDTTLNKLRVGGASAWETITSV